MFRMLQLIAPVPMFGADVLLAPPDLDGGAATSTGGDDSQSSGADDGADAGDLELDADAGGDQGDDAHSREAGDDDDLDENDLLGDDEDEDAQKTRTPEESLKALKAKNRKLRRQLLKRDGVYKRVKGLDIDDVLSRARRADEFEESLRRNPKLRSLITGDDDADDRGASRRGGKDNADDFDESKLPFDANRDAVHRWMADTAKTVHALQRENKALLQRLDGFERKDVERGERSVKTQWSQAVQAVDKQITDKKIAKLVRDAITGAYNTPSIRQKYSAQQVLAYYLKEYGASPGQARRAQAASQQRIAEGNRHRPTHPDRGGTPAGARPPRERLADVARRLRRST